MQRFELDGGAVLDRLTGLLWEQSDNGRLVTLNEARRYSDDLELDEARDWRVPTFMELYSLVSVDHSLPSIDPIFECHCFDYWTTTPWDRRNIVSINFSSGDIGWGSKDVLLYVRCVRNGL